jgi:ADP-heptose:LPS heptosyltransferase
LKLCLRRWIYVILEAAQQALLPMKAGRGLIIFPGALGDLICLSPAIRALARRTPNIKYELMARADLARFAVQRMMVTAGHSIDRSEIAMLFSQAGRSSHQASEFFGQFERIDCFFAADNERFRLSLRQAAQAEVAFYPFRPPGRGHVAEGYLRAVGANISHPLSNSIELLPDDLRNAQQRLRALGLEPRAFVLILPGSGSAGKNWAAPNFKLLSQWIAMMHPVLAVLGPAETGLAPGLHASWLTVVDGLELGELAGIARLARCFVGNDSGVSHLAAAAGARGLVIFGPTDPERWRPLGQVKIIRREPLANLSTDQVWPAVKELITAEH